MNKQGNKINQFRSSTKYEPNPFISPKFPKQTPMHTIVWTQSCNSQSNYSSQFITKKTRTMNPFPKMKHITFDSLTERIVTVVLRLRKRSVLELQSTIPLIRSQIPSRAQNHLSIPQLRPPWTRTQLEIEQTILTSSQLHRIWSEQSINTTKDDILHVIN